MIDAIPSDDQLFDALQVLIRRRIPKFKIRYKDESRWQRFVGKLAFFNRKYMTNFVTTSGPNVWYPSRKFIQESKIRAFKILAHEYVHMLDRKKHPIVFEMVYAAPQWLMLFVFLSLLAIWFSNWWLTALTSLIFLAPWPAFGRAILEIRGYGMSIAINIWRHGSVLDSTKENIENNFTGWNYYKMWPFKETVKKWIADYERLTYNIDAIRTDETILEQSEAYQEVYELLTGIENG